MALSTLMWILASATTPLFSAGGTPYVLINSTNAPNNLQIDQNRSVRITVKPRTGADFECHLIGSTGRVDLDVASCDIFKGSGVLPNIKTNRRGVAEYVVFWTNYPSASKNKAITIGGERYISSLDLTRYSQNGPLHGRYGFHVRTDGKIRGCRALETSGSNEFVADICGMLIKRALFIPTRDASGEEIESEGDFNVNFKGH